MAGEFLQIHGGRQVGAVHEMLSATLRNRVAMLMADIVNEGATKAP
jgi:hypothetical protein